MSDLFRVGFCISGSGRLFRAAALHATELSIEPALVVAEHKAGSGLEAFCATRRIPFVRMGIMSRPDFDKKLCELCIDAHLNLLSLTFDKIVPPALIRHYAGRVINVHPALLPAHKGLNALQQAVDAGVRFSGATIHEADEMMDNGPIIAQCVLSLRAAEDAASIGRRTFPLLRLMYLQVLAWYVEGRVFKDAEGRIWVRDAVYGELPFSPALERGFAD